MLPGIPSRTADLRNTAVIVDAGRGGASDVALADGTRAADGVLLNTGIAAREGPVRNGMGDARACEAGRLAFRAGRIPRKLMRRRPAAWEGRLPMRIRREVDKWRQRKRSKRCG